METNWRCLNDYGWECIKNPHGGVWRRKMSKPHGYQFTLAKTCWSYNQSPNLAGLLYKGFFPYSPYMLADQQKCRPLSLILASRMKKKPVSRHCWNHGTMWRLLKLLFGADITISTPIHWSQQDIRLSLLSKEQEGWPWKVGNILIIFKCTTSNLVIMVWYLTIPHSEINDL